MKVSVGSVVVELMDAGDRVVAHQRDGGFEPESLAVWATLCAKGGCVIDVGAYTGIYAIAAALYGCRVIAFEPMDRNAARFLENAMLNGVADRIGISRDAVSDKVGAGVLSYNPAMAGLTSGASLKGTRTGKKRVATTTIDALGLSTVAAIKIDVEGGEADVLRGARGTIERCKPSIIVEVLDALAEQAVLDALPSYRVARTLDANNWLMVPA